MPEYESGQGNAGFTGLIKMDDKIRLGLQLSAEQRKIVSHNEVMLKVALHGHSELVKC